MKNKKNRLVIAPHIDDDILGCCSVMEGGTTVLYCGVDDFHIVSREDRLKEAESVKKYLGHDYILLENKVNKYSTVDLISAFEKTINALKPAEVYIPHPSYNQDHRAAYEAALIALRPHDKNFFVKKILVYEQPHVFFWDHNYGEFKPNYFVDLDIDKKVESYKLMHSQVRNFRSCEHLLAMAKMRGAQSNFFTAESFQILRWVD